VPCHLVAEIENTRPAHRKRNVRSANDRRRSARNVRPLSSFRSSPPRTRRSSASSVGSVQNLQSAQLHAPPRSISSNRSRSPTPHRPTAAGRTQQHQQSTDEPQKKRSRSPTPHRKLLASPNQGDLAKQRSMSPTPWASLRSRSPTPRKNADPSRRNANEEPRSPTHHGKPQENGRVRILLSYGSVFLGLNS